jgi:hypothetical protein
MFEYNLEEHEIMKKRQFEIPRLIITEVVAISVVILAVTSLIFFIAAAVDEDQQPWQPDIKASDIYQYYTMVLGKDIKNLVIVMSNG